MRAVHSIRLSLILITALALSGCFDGSSSHGDDTSTGRLNYNGISGLSYTTASQTGTTNSRGEFRYYPGETLSFRVGTLLLAEDIPAQEFVTPIEFFANLRDALKYPSVNDEGLSSHEGTEVQLMNDVPLSNLVRFLISLNWEVNVREGKGIDIRNRVIQQLNAKLPNLTAPIDFNVGALEFAASDSPANQLLAAICFYPEGDVLCEDPPTQADIDSAPIRPDDENEWDPNVEYQQDLRVKRDRILDAVRSLDDID
ncbi:MAG TPA: organic solvent ABC transporter permease, partial [Marinobacter sp.]|nr:organic solvent ABC transporter permease [Marinobacter sp.]